jgi:uncharacterized protein
MELSIANEKVILGVEKYLYLPRHKALVFSDLHIGKIDHFRKNGIGLPKIAAHEDIERLGRIIDAYDVDKCIFLGDLFHSEINNFWFAFTDFIALNNDITFILVKGNHDILEDKEYAKASIKLVSELKLGKILFTHDLSLKKGYYNLHGHIHPGVTLKGKARQSISLPCYYFDENYGVLPAFGRFTGLSILEHSNKSTVVVVAQDQLIKVYDQNNALVTT